jgi:tetratricopeptide (TPR) repeat protein
MTKFLRYSTLTLIFLTILIPLYVSNNLFFPYITGKAFAFRILVEIGFALYLLLVLRDKKYAPKFSWLSTLITGFVVVAFIADLLGVNPLRSLWSNFERMEGWVTIIHMWAYFIIMTGTFGPGEEGRRMWHNFFRATVFAAFIVGLYGVAQLIGSSTFFQNHLPSMYQWFHKNFEIHQGSVRIDASLGNAIYMAVYMLVHAFIAFYLGLVEWSRKKIGLVWLYSILGVFYGYLVFETATRGTILGLVGGLMLSLAIYAFFGDFKKGEPSKLRWWSLGIIVAFVLAGVLLIANKNAAWVQKSTVLSRLASISWSENKTQARGYIWPMAVNGILSNPKTALIGSGQENFNYIFNANYNPKMWNQEQWFDRAHNVYLDWLVAGGLATFLLYISLFVTAIVLLWKSNLSFAEKSLLTGLFVGYGIHNIFVFDNIASYMIFYTMLGFVHTISAQKPLKWLEIRDKQTENMIVVRDYIYFPIIAILFFIVLYFVNIRPIQANLALITALNSCSSSGMRPSAALYENALKYNEYVANQEIREQLLNCATSVVGASAAPADMKKEFFDSSLQEIRNQIAATPLDARIYALGGVFLDNAHDWTDAAALLQRSLELSPNKQSIMYELAQNYLNTNKIPEALDLLKKAYELAPENDNAKLAYASTLILVGQEKSGIAVYGGDESFLVDPRIVGIYAQNKNYTKAIELAKKVIEKDPNTLQNYGNLVALYYQVGDKADALKVLETMKTKFPEALKDINNAISEISGVKPPAATTGDAKATVE